MVPGVASRKTLTIRVRFRFTETGNARLFDEHRSAAGGCTALASATYGGRFAGATQGTSVYVGSCYQRQTPPDSDAAVIGLKGVAELVPAVKAEISQAVATSIVADHHSVRWHSQHGVSSSPKPPCGPPIRNVLSKLRSLKRDHHSFSNDRSISHKRNSNRRLFCWYLMMKQCEGARETQIKKNAYVAPASLVRTL